MSNDQLEDLKQFIDSRISQAELRFDRKFDERVGGVEQRMGGVEQRMGSVEGVLRALRKEMLGGFAGVGDAIEEINAHIDNYLAQLQNHQKTVY